MSDATTSSVNAPSPLAPSRSVNGSSLLGKRRTRHEQSSVKPTAGTSRTTPDFSPGDVPSPLTSPTHTSTPDTLPSKRLNLSLNHPIDNTMPEPSSSTSATTTHCPEPASPAATEIAYDISYVEPSPEDHMETLRAAGIKVRDFAYEPMPNSSKAPEVFDPVPSLIAADWHMRNPEKNYGLLSPKGLFRLIKMGWLTVTDVRLNLHPREYAALAQYNDRPDEQRYPFVVIPRASPFRPRRSACGYAVRLVLTAIRTMFRIASFSDMTLRVFRMTRGRKREGLLPVFAAFPLLPPRLRKRRRRRRHQGW